LHGRLVGPEGAGHRAVVPEVPGEAAGVDAPQPGQPVALEEGVEVALGPPVAPPPGQVADDHAAAVGPGALVVGRGDAVVADVDGGEGDDLPGVGRVGDDLLVAGHGRVEHDLPGRHPGAQVGAEQLALEEGAVVEHEHAGPDHRWASPSRTTTSPCCRVWRTRPVSVRPAYGVLRLRLA